MSNNNEYRNAVREVEREGYWTLGRAIPATLVLLLLSYGLGFLVTGGDLAIYKFWAPKQEQVRREVFEQTKSYRQGMIQELQNMQFDYVKAAPEHQAALASIILHRAADVPADALTHDLNAFIQKLKQDQSASR